VKLVIRTLLLAHHHHHHHHQLQLLLFHHHNQQHRRFHLALVQPQQLLMQWFKLLLHHLQLLPQLRLQQHLLLSLFLDFRKRLLLHHPLCQVGPRLCFHLALLQQQWRQQAMLSVRPHQRLHHLHHHHSRNRGYHRPHPILALLSFLNSSNNISHKATVKRFIHLNHHRVPVSAQQCLQTSQLCGGGIQMLGHQQDHHQSFKQTPCLLLHHYRGFVQRVVCQL
jgi:hypothetical protein